MAQKYIFFTNIKLIDKFKINLLHMDFIFADASFIIKYEFATGVEYAKKA